MASLVIMESMPLKKRLIGVTWVIGVAALTAHLKAMNWLPISDEDKESSECYYEKDAAIEALYQFSEGDFGDADLSYRQYYTRFNGIPKGRNRGSTKR